MTYAYPLSLAALYDLLPITSVKFDDARFNEYSGIGSGHDLQSELADPKWKADVEIAIRYHDEGKQLAARFRKLKGPGASFFINDPLSRYPQSDPDGSLLGASAVQVHTVGGQSLRLKGLPATFVLTVGDKGQILVGSNNYFFEVSETVTAVAGVTPTFEVFPYVPAWVAANQAVILKLPACKMMLLPDGFDPGTSRSIFTNGMSFKAIEKK